MSQLLKNYLNKQLSRDALISDPPEKDLQLVIIIPAFNEPDILKTLESLKKCKAAKFSTEVLILINHSDKTPNYIKEQNKQTRFEVSKWIETESSSHLKFHCLYNGDCSEKHAGVGLARKTLMDEAVRRFDFSNNEMGIIASFDADSLVSDNYISEIQKVFFKHKNLNCTTFFFEHRITKELSDKNKNAIILYELYLRYFKLALQFTHFPYAFHTVGSSFAVRASAYAKQGGMSKRQAGEDFYFLHKIFPLGNCLELNNVFVYPSSRSSDRVPFGTGNAVQKIMHEGDFLTYNPIYFEHIRSLFGLIDKFFKADKDDIASIYRNLDPSLQSFISEEDFIKSVMEINKNSASETTFSHRFYQWFDAFKIIKYLNFVHHITTRIPVIEAARLFLQMQDKPSKSEDPYELLNIFKEMELGQVSSAINNG